MGRPKHNQRLGGIVKCKVKTALLCIAIGLSTTLVGCSKPEPAFVPEVATPQTSQAAGEGKPSGGATIDTHVSPAPPGVKTGLEGGKK